MGTKHPRRSARSEAASPSAMQQSGRERPQNDGGTEPPIQTWSIARPGAPNKRTTQKRLPTTAPSKPWCIRQTRWKRVKRAPWTARAAASQPFDDNSLLGQAAVFRAKRAKRHKPAGRLKDQPPGRLLPFKDGTAVNVKRKLSVGAAPEAGQPEVEALVREPMGRDGSLESDWNLRRIGALLAKSEAMDDAYAVARRKIFNPLPTTQDKASKAPVTGLRTSGLVTEHCSVGSFRRCMR